MDTEEISIPLHTGQILGLDYNGNLTMDTGGMMRPVALVEYRNGVAHLIIKSAPVSMRVYESGPIVIG